MLSILNRLETDNTNEKAQYAEALFDDFNKSAEILACYMNHDDVDAAKEAIVSLRSAVHHHDEDEILSAAEMVRTQLEKLRDIDSIQLKNVL